MRKKSITRRKHLDHEEMIKVAKVVHGVAWRSRRGRAPNGHESDTHEEERIVHGTARRSWRSRASEGHKSGIPKNEKHFA